MSDIAVVRTLGSVYVVTPEHWGKVTSLRPGQVPVSRELQKFPKPAHLLEGADYRSPGLPKFHAAGVNDLSPGMHPLHLAGRRNSDWARTSSVVAVYTGVLVDEVQPGAEHIVLEPGRATWVDRSGTLTHSWLPNGHDSPERAVTDGLVGSHVDAYILRVTESKLPGEGSELVAERFPGWADAYRRFTSQLARIGVRVRAVMHDPHFEHRPLILLSDLPPRGSPGHVEFESLMAGFVRYTDTCCQQCGADSATPVTLPSPYLLDSYLYCPSCRAFAVADRMESVTPLGGPTKLAEPGHTVTIWRTDAGLHLITPWGHQQVVSFNERQPAMPEYPMPRPLKHYSKVYRWHSFPNLRDGRQLGTWLSAASEVLPGMTVGLANDRDEFTVLTPLEVLHGVICSIDDVNDTEDFFIWMAPGAPPHREQAWRLHHGVSTQLVQHGWDQHPTLDFTPSDHVPEERGEIGVLRVEQALSGMSGSRAAFDRFAPGWMQYLDFIHIALHEIPRNTVELVHADVDPLSGRPVVRLIGVPPQWGHPAIDLRGAWRSFLAGCLSSCSTCGKAGRLIELPTRHSGNNVRRYLCPTHYEQEDPVWNF